MHKIISRMRFSSPSAVSRRNALLGAAALLAGLVGFGTAATAAPATLNPQPSVALKTSLGTITVQLDPQKAPKTVANFLEYVRAGQYNGTVFHRVIPGFMVQGGGYDARYQEKPTRGPIPLEARGGLSNATGTIAMARTSDPDSATSQFFINTANNTNLDYPSPDGNGYAVFGKVTSGMDVVRKIEGVATGNRGSMANVPTQPVTIESATVLNQ